MKTHFLNKILALPMHIDRGSGRRFIARLTSLARPDPRNERPAETDYGDPLPKMQIVDDVAIIPIFGTLLVNVPDWIKRRGLAVTDANDIEEELDRATNDPAVKFTTLDVDSPGGGSIAGDKLFDLVEAANKRKPVFSFCADGNMIGSSAYEAAAPSRAILAGKYCVAGSIGSYCVVQDDSEYWKMQGIAWEVFRSGELKGIGEDAITEPQKAFLQASVDAAGARFRKNVAKYRTEIAEDDMRGQYWTGEEAAKRGFAAGTARDLSSAIAKFRRML